MEYAVGAGLALGMTAFGALTGFDRDRAFYPTALVVIASYYDLFAIQGGGAGVLGLETIGLAAFICLSVVGFRTNLWIVAGALAGHGLFDLVHGRLVADAGVPGWWPMFCLSFDGVAAGSLAWRLASGRIDARPAFGGVTPRQAPAPRMLPDDLSETIAIARTTAGTLLTAVVVIGTLLGASACSSPPGDVRAATERAWSSS